MDHLGEDLRIERVSELVTGGVDWVGEQMPQFLRDLELLSLTESPSEDKVGLDRMADLLAGLLQRVGMETKIVEHARGNAVVGTLAGTRADAPTCLLLGHHDTVHPVGVARVRVRTEEGRFYGPGTVDMKAGLLQGIYALAVLHQQGYTDLGKIVFLSVPDEEITSRYQLDLVRQVAQEGSYVLGLEGARSVGNVVLRRKGCIQYRLTAEGLAAHAGSAPERGRNAVLELAHQIVQAQGLMGWREGLTINAGPVRGGSRANIVSDFAEILFDVRFLRPQDRLDAEARWQEYLSNRLVPDVRLTLQAEPDAKSPMVETEGSLAIARQIQLIAEQMLKTPYDPETRGGGSDCCDTSAMGNPTVDGLGAIGGGAHTSEEYVVLEPVPARVALLAGLLAALALPARE